MNVYYCSLSRLYNTGKIIETQIQIAVAKGWITEEEANSIINMV